MSYDPSNPFIVQGDRTVLVEVDNPKYAEARDALAADRAQLQAAISWSVYPDQAGGACRRAAAVRSMNYFSARIRWSTQSME